MLIISSLTASFQRTGKLSSGLYSGSFCNFLSAAPPPSLTSFDVDILTPDLARGVLGSAVVRVVVDQLAVAGRQEVEDLQGSVRVDVADPWDIVDLLASGQIPAERGRGRSPSGTGHRGPCGAGKYYLLQRCIDKV